MVTVGEKDGDTRKEREISMKIVQQRRTKCGRETTNYINGRVSEHTCIVRQIIMIPQYLIGRNADRY